MSFTRRAFTRALAAGVLLPTPRALAKPATLPAVRAAMQRFVDQKVVAGVVTLVGTPKGVLHHEAVGFADLESRRPMRPDNIFRIASMTKPITALGIMMLAEQGKLTIDDPVEKHLPEFRGVRVVKSGKGDDLSLGKPARPPTLKDLLTHQSGLGEMPPPGFAELYAKRNRTLAEAVAAFSQRPLSFEPGSQWRYSNTGIDTLGRVIEVLAGTSYERFFEQRVFRPLGMRDTHFYAPRAKAARVATLYTQQGDGLSRISSWLGGDDGGVYPLPAGGLFSTAQDLARLYAALAAGGRSLIKPETLAEMTRVHTGDQKAGFGPGMGFGLGFAVVREPTDATAMLSPGTYGHGGAFGTQGWIDPGRKTFFVLLIQRERMPGGDHHEVRREFQRLAVEGLG